MDFLHEKFNKFQRESFLKTRLDSLILNPEIRDILQKNSILTVRGLVSRDLAELSLLLGGSYLNTVIQAINDSSSEFIKQVESEVPLIKLDDSSYFDNGLFDSVKKNDIDFSNVDDLIAYFATYFNANKADLIGHCRKNSIVKIRDVIIFILRKHCDLSFPAIGKLMGGRDHTTIMYSYKKMEGQIVLDDDFKYRLQKLVSHPAPVENKVLVEKIRVPQVVEISARNLQVLSLFREGHTLHSMGEIIGVTRQRVRQIIISALKQKALNESISSGAEVDFSVLLEEEKKIRDPIVASKKASKQKRVKIEKVHSWSRYYPACKSCGTDKIPHFRSGLCDDCGNRSIYGEARELIIKEHNNVCDICSISREDSMNGYGRDFYISRKTKKVLCRKCFTTEAGKNLSKIKMNKWRMFFR